MTTNIPGSQKGFTILEIIAVLILGSILAAFLAPAIRTSVSQSATPLVNLQQAMSFCTTMELISADYRAMVDAAWAAGTPVDLNTLKTKIGTGSQNNGYGSYTVLDNKFIEFTGNTEQNSAGTTLLRVRIQDSTGMIYGSLFTQK